MTARVAIPLSLRLDSRTAAEGGTRLEAAAQRAVDRALDAMLREFADRGDTAEFVATPPRISWRGEGAGRVDPDARAATERLLSDFLALRLAARCAERARQGAMASDPLPDDARTRFDPARAMLGTIALDSYETGDGSGPPDAAPERAPVVFLSHAGAFHERYDVYEQAVDLYAYVGEAALIDAVRTVISMARAQGHQVPGGRIGFIYRDRGHRGQMTRKAALFDFEGDVDGDLRVARRFTLGGGTSIHPTEIENGISLEASGSTSIGGFGVHGLHRLPMQGDPSEAFLERMYALYNERIEAYIAATYGSGAGEQAQTVRDQVRDELRERVDGSVAEMRAANPGGPYVLAVYREPGGTEITGLYPDVFGTQQLVPLFPILQVVARSSEQDAGGGDGAPGTGGPADTDADGSSGAGQDGTGSGADGSGGEDGDGAGGAGGDDPERAGNLRPQPFRFPAPTISGEGEELTCEPFLEELSLKELGASGKQIEWLMRRIAWRLSMPMCAYPGQFLINAAKVWGGRAASASGFAGQRSATLRRREGQDGTLGDFDFEPAPSPVIDTIRHLGTTTVPMKALLEELYDLYTDPTWAARLKGYYKYEGVLWNLRLRESFVPQMKQSVAYGFKVACQSCLLQMCLTSRQQILERTLNFDNYFPLIDSLLRTFMARPATLEVLRKKLNAHYATHAPDMASSVATVASTWKDARQDLMAALGASETAEILEASEDTIGHATVEHEIVPLPGGGYGIKDAQGKVWTREELSQAVALASGLAQSIDPLVGKLTDLPQAVVIAQSDQETSKRLIRTLLQEMLDKNTEVTSETEASAQYAFRASKINESIPRATVPGTSWQLGGIHLAAHEAIGDAFLGNPFYGLGIDHAFGVEAGTQELAVFFEIVGVALLSIACPPLGIAAGVGLAGAHLYVAHERAEITTALFDNDLVLTNAEAELDLFLAELEAVFSIIPLTGKALKLGGRGAMGLARSGTRQAGRRALRGITKDVVEDMAAQLKQGLAIAFMRELASDQVMGKVAEAAMLPIIMQLQQELSLTDNALSDADAAAADPALGSAAARVRAAHDISERLREGEDERNAQSEGAEQARRGEP